MTNVVWPKDIRLFQSWLVIVLCCAGGRRTHAGAEDSPGRHDVGCVPVRLTMHMGPGSTCDDNIIALFLFCFGESSDSRGEICSDGVVRGLLARPLSLAGQGPLWRGHGWSICGALSSGHGLQFEGDLGVRRGAKFQSTLSAKCRSWMSKELFRQPFALWWVWGGGICPAPNMLWLTADSPLSRRDAWKMLTNEIRSVVVLV